MAKARWRRRGMMFLGGVFLAYTATCAYMWSQQVRLIFKPQVTYQTTPDRMGMEYERVAIPIGEDGRRGTVSGFWVPVKESSAPTFLYLHGQDATIGKNLDHTQRLHHMGFNVLLVDYRGFGESHFGGGLETDSLSEESVYEDAEAAWQFLRDKRGLPPGAIFIYGHSLGGAVAIDLALRHHDAAGLVTEATFTSIVDLASKRYKGMFPMKMLIAHEFDSIGKIHELKIPILLIHGTVDQKVPCEMCNQLFRNAPAPKEQLIIKGGGHADSGRIASVAYRQRVERFVAQYQ